MKKARIILVIVALAGIAGGSLAYRPTIFYKPAYVGGVCTVAFTPYYSIIPDTGNAALLGKTVELATNPGPCKNFVILGE
jgi:hypothetical protein